MIKNATYQEKFQMLDFWNEEIIETVKKDLKNDHLSKDKVFSRRYFLGKNPLGIDKKVFCNAYKSEISAGNVQLAEFIATRWLLKHTDIYGYFEEKLKKITGDFEQLEELDLNFSQVLVKEAVDQFGAKNSYIFSIFNSVVFPQLIFDFLKDEAIKTTRKEREERQTKEERLTLEEMKKRHERELKAIKDRFDKKINGLQKKYIIDTEVLKKKIVLLEQHIAGQN